MCLTGLRTSGFDNIRIDSALRQPIYIFELGRLFIEYIDKGITDDFAFLFWLIDTCKPAKKTLFRICSKGGKENLNPNP